MTARHCGGAWKKAFTGSSTTSISKDLQESIGDDLNGTDALRGKQGQCSPAPKKFIPDDCAPSSPAAPRRRRGPACRRIQRPSPPRRRLARRKRGGA